MGIPPGDHHIEPQQLFEQNLGRPRNRPPQESRYGQNILNLTFQVPVKYVELVLELLLEQLPVSLAHFEGCALDSCDQKGIVALALLVQLAVLHGSQQLGLELD
jgi:hypothetical protein